jgi:predicted S18 family serine protease
LECNRKITQLLVLLLVILLSSTPAAAQYVWNGFQLNGDASNPAWVYNGTVASGTVYGDVYIDCGHGADYLNPS